MPLGWIDFSNNERNKVLSVLDLLSENSTLDELGIIFVIKIPKSGSSIHEQKWVKY